MIFDIRENLERYRKLHNAHSRPMAVGDLMQADDGRLARLEASLARIGPFWDSIARAESERREALSR